MARVDIIGTTFGITLTVVYVSVKVYQSLVEEVTAFEKQEDANKDLAEWKKEHKETEGSSVWICPV